MTAVNYCTSGCEFDEIFIFIVYAEKLYNENSYENSLKNTPILFYKQLSLLKVGGDLQRKVIIFSKNSSSNSSVLNYCLVKHRRGWPVLAPKFWRLIHIWSEFTPEPMRNQRRQFFKKNDVMNFFTAKMIHKFALVQVNLRSFTGLS